MRHCIYLFLIFFFTSFSHAISIDENSSKLSILDKASIFIDTKNTLSLAEIKEQKFVKNIKNTLNLGYTTNKALWIKFTLINKTSNKLKKTLVFDSEKIESVILYDSNQIKKGGFHHLDENRKSLPPSFILNFNAHESKTYYVQTTATSKPLKIKITLWNAEDFIKHDSINIILKITFLGMMIILLLYNTIIFLFIKNKAYLYYILYLLSLILMNSYYSGFIPYYLLSPELASWSMKLHMAFPSLLFAFTILFTQEVLQTKKFIKLHKTLNLILYFLPLVFILGYNSNFLNPYLLSIFISIGILLIYTGFYSLFKGVYEAKYYVFAWTPLISILTVFTLETSGLYTLGINLTYLSDLSFVLEALLFSIALAHRIKIANDQKAFADAQLIFYQEKEKEHLNTLVLEKTNDLEKALIVKGLLYKELNHRIRNNFMVILSLLRLQISRTKVIHTKDSLKIMENRIKSISNLYQMMILNNENINVNTAKYLDRIAQDVKISFKTRVRINYDIQHNIEVDSLIYVGLIFNELISNSIKHAFTDNEGEIFVTLKKENDTIYLNIKDNGKGFTQQEKKSLGLIIVETLVEDQLDGKLSINSSDGTDIMISWKEE